MKKRPVPLFPCSLFLLPFDSVLPSIISMGGVLQTIKFLSAAAGVGLCLNGMDKLAQRIDECVF